MGGLDWAQFKALFWAIRKGEQSAEDNLGLGDMGFGGGDGGRSVAKTVGAVFAFIVIAGLMFVIGSLFGSMGTSVASGFNMLVMILVVLTVLVGFYSAVSGLFLVSDLSFYVALPVSGQTIMWAKLANYFANATLMDAAILPFGLGVLVNRGEGPLAWVFMILAFVFCALALNVAMVLIVLPLMRFSKIAVDKDRFSRVLGAIITVLVMGISVVFSVGGHSNDGMTGASVTAVTDGVAASPVARVVLTLLCPPSALGGVAFSSEGVLPLAGVLGMAVLLAVYVLLLNWCAGKWYFDAVRGLAGGSGVRSNKRYDAAELGSKVADRSQFKAFVAVDAAQLFRVPYFFNEFVLKQWLGPIVLLGVSGATLFMNGEMGSFEQLRETAGYCEIGTLLGLLPIAATMLLSVFIGLQSYACSLAVSRDGQDFFFFRIMPIDLVSYVKAKFATNELVCRAPAAIILLVGALVIGLPPATAIVCFLIFVLGVACADLASLGMGMLSPNLTWESEAELTKGNEAFGAIFLCFLVSVVVMVLPALCFAGPYLLGIEAGFLSAVAAVAICALELAGIASLVFGRFVRKLAVIEP